MPILQEGSLAVVPSYADGRGVTLRAAVSDRFATSAASTSACFSTLGESTDPGVTVVAVGCDWMTWPRPSIIKGHPTAVSTDPSRDPRFPISLYLQHFSMYFRSGNVSHFPGS